MTCKEFDTEYLLHIIYKPISSQYKRKDLVVSIWRKDLVVSIWRKNKDNLMTIDLEYTLRREKVL
jgi:hypothetical protein